MKIKIAGQEDVISTKATNLDAHEGFIAVKHPSGTAQPDELENAEAKEEQLAKELAEAEAEGVPAVPPVITVFHYLPGTTTAIMYDYMFKGLFKEAIGSMNLMDPEFRGGIKDKLTAYKKKIDGLVFVYPRLIPITVPEGKKIYIFSRTVRAETPQGPRIAIVRSETIPAGWTCEIEVKVMAKALVPWVMEALNYGALRGMGAWRNGSYGRFTWELLDGGTKTALKKAA